MRKKTLISALMILAIAGAPARVTGGEAQAPKELRIVFIAYQNPDQLIDDIEPVVEYLERAIGMSIKHFVATGYAGVVEALRNETADMGFMGPLQYVMAHRLAGARPILGEIYNGKSTYVSRVFVRRDADIGSVADLKGKSIAFVDPISSSGYLYPLTIFNDKGLIEAEPGDFFSQVYFAGGDEQAIRAVYNGFVDAAGIGQYAYNLLRFDERSEVKTLAESRPIPSHCVVVRENLHEETIEKIRSALLDLNAEGPDHALLEKLYNVDGYIKVTHENYAEVEQLARSYGFIK